MSSVWDGGWERRLGEQIVRKGHRSLTGFIESFPMATMVQLVQELGGDFAPEQLLRVYRDEASTDPERFMAFARSTLARRIFRLMPQGWGVVPFEHVHVYGCWSTDVGEEHYDAATRVFDALDAIAPRGWIPSGPDDPILLKAFESW